MKYPKIFITAISIFVVAFAIIVHGNKDHNPKDNKAKESEHSCCEAKSSELKVFACPMDEHKNTAYANKGDCPKCGMKLKEKEVCEIYICPMEEHQDKVYLKDGKCPDCGMKLKKAVEVPEKAKSYKPKKNK